MNTRRSFLQKLGLAATAVAASAKAEAPELPPPAPQVKSRKAFVTTVSGNAPVTVRHGLGSFLICAMAGSKDGKAIPAQVESISSDSCKVTVPKTERSLFSWRRKKSPQLYSLVIYVPA